MNILFLVDPLQNYVSDPLHLGLVRILGQHRVMHYPPKAMYHDPSAKLWFLPQIPKVEKTEAEIKTLLAERFFDMVCISSHRQEPLDAFVRLYDPSTCPPIVFIDESDDARIRFEIAHRYPIAVYFKRDYVWNMGRAWKDPWARLVAFRGDRQLFARTVPLPLSLAIDAMPDFAGLRKEIDVSYRGRASHPRRAKAMQILSSMPDLKFTGGLYASPGDRKYKLQTGVSRLWSKYFRDTPAEVEDLQQKEGPAAYYREIAASKMALALRGGGHTASLRYFEIVAMGSLLLSDMPETVIPNDFVSGRHAVYCRPDLKNLESLVRYYLKADAERETMVKDAYSHLLKHHTCERRAEYFLGACAKMI
jgi:hypothetical protein